MKIRKRAFQKDLKISSVVTENSEDDGDHFATDMTDYSQEFGEGVDRLYEVMKSEGLPQPEYKTQAFKLSATIRNTKTDGNLWATPQATPQAEQIFTFCVTVRTRNEIAEHFGVKDQKFFLSVEHCLW